MIDRHFRREFVTSADDTRIALDSIGSGWPDRTPCMSSTGGAGVRATAPGERREP
ncbi:hypothetical protein BN971_02764 [Mycobacterium bohemicum DSM 44277]|uniref:Uncharacterized protein n=1 Tax=Mycobacterium bohemicum DSM 44277 TaxID=1236609 RepID=A0A0U0W972_MYCBE|nr:hypothetical protein [Mycobacterium bohemicum]MCV6969180.1 hypothetical protein [Mycobacterium bohemicum]CPR11478.1 hypothetical protein BN971_02764 [Mycobacterium bohemicum DSM 44277]